MTSAIGALSHRFFSGYAPVLAFIASSSSGVISTARAFEPSDGPTTPRSLEQVHEPAGAGEPDPQLALEHRRRAELRAHDELHGRLEQLVVVVVAAAAAAAAAGPVVVALDALDVLRLGPGAASGPTTLRTSSSPTHAPWMRRGTLDDAAEQQHVALADEALGAGLVEDARGCRPAIDTANASRDGTLALMTPVMTSTDGRCVAMTRWMPTARAIWAMRQIESSTSRAATIIRSLSSSTTTRMNGRRSYVACPRRARAAGRRGRTPRCSR